MSEDLLFAAARQFLLEVAEGVRSAAQAGVEQLWLPHLVCGGVCDPVHEKGEVCS